MPRSGRDRSKIAGEFKAGLELLRQAAERMGDTDVHEIWVHARDDGTAIVHRAALAPNGTFRLWGRAAEVNLVLDRLLSANGDRLTFASPELARDALLSADDGLLDRLEPAELEP